VTCSFGTAIPDQIHPKIVQIVKEEKEAMRIRLAVRLCVLLAAPAANAWELQWYGHAAFRVVSPTGNVILIDPFISKNPKTPVELKDLSKLGKVDLILLNHGHGDHIGATARISKTTGAKVVVNSDLGRTLNSLGRVPYQRLIRVNKSGSTRPLEANITITMVRAEHSSEVVEKDPETKAERIHPGGEPVGFIIELENGYKIYYAGDTGVFADMKFIADYSRPDLALLPIGGQLVMDSAHAAYAVKKLLRTPTVVPIHYGTIPPLTGTPEQFIAALGDYTGEVLVMKPGEIRKFPD
jgi:L-ascorbate metabolism protein UlaG (beta-lactamase superfamily)